VKNDGSRVIDKVVSNKVGYQLATKKVGRNGRDDVKGNYKGREGSDAERRQVSILLGSDGTLSMKQAKKISSALYAPVTL
jgi:hypothetical protein